MRGTIVTPISPAEHEVIIGVVIDTINDDPLVFWISNQRGTFICWEGKSDVVIADLSERADYEQEYPADAIDPLDTAYQLMKARSLRELGVG